MKKSLITLLLALLSLSLQATDHITYHFYTRNIPADELTETPAYTIYIDMLEGLLVVCQGDSIQPMLQSQESCFYYEPHEAIIGVYDTEDHLLLKSTFDTYALEGNTQALLVNREDQPTFQHLWDFANHQQGYLRYIYTTTSGRQEKYIYTLATRAASPF